MGVFERRRLGCGGTQPVALAGWIGPERLRQERAQLDQEGILPIEAVGSRPTDLVTFQHATSFEFLQLPLDSEEVSLKKLRHLARVPLLAGKDKQEAPFSVE